LDDYHVEIDKRLGVTCPGSEIIGEHYVPRSQLADFLAAARWRLRSSANVIYGTIRLIEADGDSYLPWAREPFACVVLNLHTDHNSASIADTASCFRDLIDLALARGGSFYLTYHRFATARQVAAAYPRFRAFLRHKREFDPEERFQSDWYRHYAAQLDAMA
jgi:FAD/FMN-containing dehydrogenase